MGGENSRSTSSGCELVDLHPPFLYPPPPTDFRCVEKRIKRALMRRESERQYSPVCMLRGWWCGVKVPVLAERLGQRE